MGANTALALGLTIITNLLGIFTVSSLLSIALSTLFSHDWTGQVESLNWKLPFVVYKDLFFPSFAE